MKRKASFILVAVLSAGLLVPVKAKADLFGADLAFLSQLVAQGISMIKQAADLYATEQKAQHNIEQAAHFIAHPSWSGVLQRGQDALETYSDTSDAGKLARLRRQIQIGREAIQEANGQPLTLDAAANVSRLSLEVAGAKEQASALEAQMKSDQRIKEIGSGYGHVTDGLWRDAK
ncbi:MAG: hypothetical protein ACJ73N_16295 [Bryobacteraceae bacterium]